MKGSEPKDPLGYGSISGEKDWIRRRLENLPPRPAPGPARPVTDADLGMIARDLEPVDIPTADFTAGFVEWISFGCSCGANTPMSGPKVTCMNCGKTYVCGDE